MNIKRITLGVFVATLVNGILGALWYSPMLFGERWANLVNVTLPTEFMLSPILGALVCAFITALIMMCFMYRLRINTLRSGFHFGWMSWLGFVAPTTFQYVIFEHRPLELYLINNGFNVLASVCMALIIAFALKDERFYR